MSSSGVDITGVNSIKIGDGALLSNRNTLNNLFIGIIANNSNINGVNNLFTNIPLGVSAGGNISGAAKTVNIGVPNPPAFEPNIFTNCSTALLLGNNLNVDIESNQFTNILNGALITNCKNRNVRVQSNQFVNYSTSAVNITETGGSNPSVLNNNLNQSGTPATTNAIGIQVQNVNRVATAFTFS